jgi:hypothetical protein
MKRHQLVMVAALCAIAASAYGNDLPQQMLNRQDAQQGPSSTDTEKVTAGSGENDQTPSQPGSVREESIPELRRQVRELNEKMDQLAEAQSRSFPSIFNPAIGFVGETVFGYRSKGPSQTGSDRPGGFDFFQRSVELNASASVDPFAKGYVVINASADPVTGEASLGVEEAALQTTSLPGNLELKAGRFFGEFGRLSYIHDHELPFVNRPLVLDRFVGGESRSDGLQVNWLVPTEHYLSLTVGAGNQFGGDTPNPNNAGDFRHLSGLNFWGRLSTSFELTPDLSLEPGISGLWNPRTIDRGGPLAQADGSTLTEKERRLYGADLVLSHKPLANNQFQSTTWGTEVLVSDNRFEVNGGDLGQRDVSSVGLYSYLEHRFHRQWSAGFLYEYVQSPQDRHAHTSAYSPYLTWATSHWSQIRLQYTYTDPNSAAGHVDDASGAFMHNSPDHAVYLQWAWIIGAHSHGWQQR